MTYNEIYLAALNHIGEPSHSQAIADYKERAPRLISAVIARLYSEYVRYTNNGDNMSEPPICTSLDSLFPFDEALHAITAILLASKLVADSSPELSKRLGDDGANMLSKYRAAVSDVGSVTEVYPD